MGAIASAGVFNLELGRWLVYTRTMNGDLMNVSTEDLLAERNRFKVERSYAYHCDDPDWIETLDHEIDIIEVELNRRVGDQRGM